MTSIVEFYDFSFRYPHMEEDIIKNASFTIEEGTLTLLYGLSGSGKSTLCYAMTGLIPWSVRGFLKGNVKVCGKYTNEIKPNQFAGEIGYLMQNPDSQFATLTVEDELVFAAENIQVDKDEIENRFTKIVSLLDLEGYLGRNVTQLSSGEKQRVVLGSILLMGPRLLILDEPLSFLDFPNRLKLLDYLKRILIQYPRLSIIIAEHRIHDISPLTNNYLEIKNGLISNSLDVGDRPRKYVPSSISSFSYAELAHHHGFKERRIDNKDREEHAVLSFDMVSFSYIRDHGKFEQIVANVFQDISFKIYSGETIAIIGPNGIGKTTLLYLVAGILQPSNGEIQYLKQDISKMRYGKYSKNIGLIFQNPESQLLKNTLRKEIEFGPKNFSLPIGETDFQKYAQFIFPTSSINHEILLNLHPFNLSWGEKRRLNLTSLFAYSPSVYLFDEPFTGQDYAIRRKLMENIKSISKENGTTIISSHDEEFLQICDRIFVMDKESIREYEKNQV